MPSATKTEALNKVESDLAAVKENLERLGPEDQDGLEDAADELDEIEDRLRLIARGRNDA